MVAYVAPACYIQYMTSNVTQQQTQYLIGRAVTTPRKTTEWVQSFKMGPGYECEYGMSGIKTAAVRFTIQRHIAKKFLSKEEVSEALTHLPSNKGWTIYRAVG